MSKAEKKMGRPSLSVVRAGTHPERVKSIGQPLVLRKEKRWGFRYEYHMCWWNEEKSRWTQEERWFPTEKGRDQAFKVFERRMKEWKWYRNPVKIVKIV